MSIFQKMLPRALVKPLILLLLGSQFATLAHALEHEAADSEDEACFICLHQSNSTHILGGAKQKDPPDFRHGPEIRYRLTPFSHQIYARPNNRSPPWRETGNHPAEPGAVGVIGLLAGPKTEIL